MAVASGILQVTGVPGSIVLAAAILGLVLVVSGLYALFVRAKPGRPRRMNLGEVLAKYGKESQQIDCVFSAGDQLRTCLDAGAHDPRKVVLSTGTTVRLVTRQRSDGEEIHVFNNMLRLEERIQALRSTFSHRTAVWDNFMLGGLIFEHVAAVKFYHRKGGRTAAIGEGFLVVDRRRGGYESELFEAMRVAFDCLWASANSSR
ncbi:hypothetical protein [Arthrobacter parietis]|uniref:hypothetical protein n=1 Tax=Arthrobacter parietis TaxID=271434 RepID=UPI0031F896CA